MTERGARTLRVPRGLSAGVLALAALGFVLVLIASTSGPVDFVTAPKVTATETLPTVTPSSETVTPTTPPTGAAGLNPDNVPPLPAFVVKLIQILIWATVLFVLVLLFRVIWRNTPRWQSRLQQRTDVTLLPDVPEELTRSAGARMALLGEGDPRNAIVACWLDLEDAAASVGIPRQHAETSAEYTTRVLATWDVAPEALSGLAELYREARFSRHALTEEHRSAAITRLTTLHDDLRRVADERAAARAAEATAAQLEAGRNVGAGTGTRAGGDR